MHLCDVAIELCIICYYNIQTIAIIDDHLTLFVWVELLCLCVNLFLQSSTDDIASYRKQIMNYLLARG